MGRDGRHGDLRLVEMRQRSRPYLEIESSRQSPQGQWLSVLCEPPNGHEELTRGSGTEDRTRVAPNEEPRRKADRCGTRLGKKSMVALPRRARMAGRHRPKDEGPHVMPVLRRVPRDTRPHARRPLSARGQNLASDEERVAETIRRGVRQRQESLVAMQERSRVASRHQRPSSQRLRLSDVLRQNIDPRAIARGSGSRRCCNLAPYPQWALATRRRIAGQWTGGVVEMSQSTGPRVEGTGRRKMRAPQLPVLRKPSRLAHQRAGDLEQSRRSGMASDQERCPEPVERHCQQRQGRLVAMQVGPRVASGHRLPHEPRRRMPGLPL